MTLRRSLRRTSASVLAVGALLTNSACAGDCLASDAGDDSPAASSGGPVTIASQSFPEAALMASMYELLLADAGYDVDDFPAVAAWKERLQALPGFAWQLDLMPIENWPPS